MANTLVGLFDDRSVAQGAVQDLISAGVSRDAISVVANEGSGGAQTHSVDEHGNLAGAGASAGVSSGAVVGGIAGLLIGAGFTILPIAGFLLAGPIAGLIAGAATGAATGGILGGLIGLGIPEEHAELYAEGVRRGGTLLTVQTDSSNESRVRDILNRDGAVDIETRGESYRASGFTGYDTSAKPYTRDESDAERATYASFGDDVSTTTVGAVRDYSASSSNADATDWESQHRSHFTRTNPTGSYEEYAPAYRFGRDLANDPTYGSTDWTMNEANYRTRWEEGNPGTWERFKDTIKDAFGLSRDTTRNNRANLY